jgi:hypothetical protein
MTGSGVWMCGLLVRNGPLVRGGGTAAGAGQCSLPALSQAM